MDLELLQTEVARRVKEIPLLAGLPVFEESLGDITENVQNAVSQKSFCVVCGAASFNDETPDSRLCHGLASIVITVFECPELNRKITGRPTFTKASQEIAKELKLFNTGDGLLVTKSIGKPSDLGDGCVSQDVNFEIKTTL